MTLYYFFVICNHYVFSAEQMGPSKVWAFCARVTNLRSKEWVYHVCPMQWTYKKSIALKYGPRHKAVWGEPPLKYDETFYWRKWTSCNRQVAIQTVIQTLIFMRNKTRILLFEYPGLVGFVINSQSKPRFVEIGVGEDWLFLGGEWKISWKLRILDP